MPKRAARIHPDLLEKVCRTLRADGHAGSLPGLASEAGVTADTLRRHFAEVVGVTPRQYAEAGRLGRLKERLKRGEPVTRALFEEGYGSTSRLYEKAQGRLGMTPATYRRGAPGVPIRYALAPCRLGHVLLAGTPFGVCSVKLGSSETPLVRQLREEFPEAELVRDDEGLGAWVASLLARIEGRPAPELPMDIAATAFQERVYRALLRIPAGETRSYSEVARSIGRPEAARAVARACATNPVAIVIPCHRAVGRDGSLTGYRWGVERKRALLDSEKTGAGK